MKNNVPNSMLTWGFSHGVHTRSFETLINTRWVFTQGLGKQIFWDKLKLYNKPLAECSAMGSF